MPGFTRCSDCDVDLVRELPEPSPDKQYIDFRQVLETYNPADVALIKSLLDAEDIAYYFLGEYSAPYMYHAIPLILLVKSDQVELVSTLLKDLDLSVTFIDRAIEE
jgi:hypothetical protein